MTEEEKYLLKQLGLDEEEGGEDVERKQLHPALAIALWLAATANIALLLSLPPVLRGRGAPYLPTRRTNADAMFAQLRAALGSARPQSKRLQFVDLGSGDGRLVFRASREGYHAIGCEINPLLHLFAQGARLCRPQYWSSTRFYRRDLWKVDLRQANVVAVYGLAPIMPKLGVKLQEELQPGSFVVSNVFTIPGWRPIDSSAKGTHIYRVPDCWVPKS